MPPAGFTPAEADESKGLPRGRGRVGSDGAGVTRGLAQAGASGVKVAQVIGQRLKEEI